MRNPFVIALDGPAASGKGTLARRLADHFGLHIERVHRARKLCFAGLEIGGGGEQRGGQLRGRERRPGPRHAGGGGGHMLTVGERRRRLGEQPARVAGPVRCRFQGAEEALTLAVALTATLAAGGLLGFGWASSVLGRGADAFRMAAGGALLGIGLSGRRYRPLELILLLLSMLLPLHCPSFLHLERELKLVLPRVEEPRPL